MEEMKKEHPDGCKCNMCSGSGMKSCGMCGGMYGGKCCGMCGGRRHIVLRWIVGILILVAVFCGGFKLGVMVGYLNNGGYGGHMSSGRHMMQRGYYPTGMMNGWNANGNVQQPPAMTPSK